MLDESISNILAKVKVLNDELRANNPLLKTPDIALSSR